MKHLRNEKFLDSNHVLVLLRVIGCVSYLLSDYIDVNNRVTNDPDDMDVFQAYLPD